MASVRLKGLVKQFGKEAQDRHAGLVNGLRKWRAHDLKLVKPHQFLPGPLGKPSPHLRGGFKRPSKSLAALER